MLTYKGLEEFTRLADTRAASGNDTEISTLNHIHKKEGGETPTLKTSSPFGLQTLSGGKGVFSREETGCQMIFLYIFEDWIFLSAYS